MIKLNLDFSAIKEKLNSLSSKTKIIAIAVFCVCVVLCFILAAFSGETKEDNTQAQETSSTSTNEGEFELSAPGDIAVDGNQAATDSQNLDSNLTTEPQSTEDNLVPNQEDTFETNQDLQVSTEATNTNSNTATKTSIYLYCGSFATANEASEKKASIAFTTGLLSEITSRNGTTQLVLGPYSTRDDAIAVFNKLDAQNLVKECTLETVN